MSESNRHRHVVNPAALKVGDEVQYVIDGKRREAVIVGKPEGSDDLLLSDGLWLALGGKFWQRITEVRLVEEASKS